MSAGCPCFRSLSWWGGATRSDHAAGGRAQGPRQNALQPNFLDCILSSRGRRGMTIDAGRSTPAAAADAIPRDYNFAADLLRRFQDAGWHDKVAYVDSRASWTYGQLAERVACFGRVLRHLGARREDRILICLTDTIDWPTAFLGALKIGVVPIPVNTLMSEYDYAFMLADSRATILVVSDVVYPKFNKQNAMRASVISDATDLQHVIVSGGDVYPAMVF